MLKKIATLSLLLLAFNACSDDSDSKASLDTLYQSGLLTYEECLAENTNHKYKEEKCKNVPSFSLGKAFGCVNQCENDDGSSCKACLSNAMKENADTIKSSKAYSGVQASYNRDRQCAAVWKENVDECDDVCILDRVSNHTWNYYLCLDETAALFNCEAALACDQPSHRGDSALHAICNNTNSSLYKGNEYKNSAECEDSITYHCKKEDDAFDACINKYYDKAEWHQ